MAYKPIFYIALLLSLLCTASCHLLSEPSPAAPIISITFDDQHANVFSVALPVMAAYGYRGTCFVNSNRLGNPGKLTSAEVQTLHNQYNWEIGGHSLNHEQLQQLSYAQAENSIGEDFRNLQALGVNPRTFAIPQGNCPAAYYPIIDAFYQNIRGSNDFAMTQPLDRRCLSYFPYQSTWTARIVKDRIRRGIANHESLIVLGFHRIESVADPYEDNCPLPEFTAIINYIHDLGLEVLPLAEAVDTLSP